jgi:hypothetical protein
VYTTGCIEFLCCQLPPWKKCESIFFSNSKLWLPTLNKEPETEHLMSVG